MNDSSGIMPRTSLLRALVEARIIFLDEGTVNALVWYYSELVALVLNFLKGRSEFALGADKRAHLHSNLFPIGDTR